MINEDFEQLMNADHSKIMNRFPGKTSARPSKDGHDCSEAGGRGQQKRPHPKVWPFEKLVLLTGIELVTY